LGSKTEGKGVGRRLGQQLADRQYQLANPVIDSSPCGSVDPSGQMHVIPDACDPVLETAERRQATRQGRRQDHCAPFPRFSESIGDLLSKPSRALRSVARSLLSMHVPDESHQDGVRAFLKRECCPCVTSDGADPSLGGGVRSRSADRGEDDLDAVSGEDGVEAPRVLGVSVPDQIAKASPP
jgi:hypothetical protein